MAYVPTKQTFQLEGFAEFEEQLKAMAEGFRADTIARNTLARSAGEAMQVVLTEVIATAPYDEGNTGPIHLRDTARLDFRIPNSKDKLSEYVNETDAAIAVVSVKKSAVSLAQEFGTRKLSPQPFLRPSLEKNSRRVVDILKQQLAISIPLYAAKLARRRKK